MEDNTDINIGKVRRSHVGRRSRCLKQRRPIKGRIGDQAENLKIDVRSGFAVYKLNTNICLKKSRDHIKRNNK